MKKLTVTIVLTTILILFAYKANAQDGYTYTLIDNGSYSFTIGVVPNTSTNNFATSVQGYGFTIIVPDGVTASISSSLGGGASATFFDGNDVSDTTIDGYLITETLGSPISLTAPSAGTTSNIVTIQISGAPTSGTMYILENNSTLATAVEPLKSFMQADMVDDGMATFTNVVDANAAAVSGTSSFDFSTLSTVENTLQDVTVFPNPVKDIVNISSGNTSIQKAVIHNNRGQVVYTQENNVEQLNISRLQTGIYFLKLYADNGLKTIKLVKE
ncbi:MAG: T9SS type A sorting domain-containing protein [Bacteroidota bacterium]